MGLFEWFGKGKDKITFSDEELIDANVCPNCWGTQEYNDQFYDYVKDRQMDIINKDKTAQKAFIEEFVEKNISGIRLKPQGAYKNCERCRKSFN